MWLTDFCLSFSSLVWSHWSEERAGGYDGYMLCYCGCRLVGVFRFGLVVVERFGKFCFRTLVTVPVYLIATVSISAEDGDQRYYRQAYGYDLEICRPGVRDGGGGFCKV